MKEAREIKDLEGHASIWSFRKNQQSCEGITLKSSQGVILVSSMILSKLFSKQQTSKAIMKHCWLNSNIRSKLLLKLKPKNYKFFF